MKEFTVNMKKSVLCVFFESYFWKSFKESVINEKNSNQAIIIMTSEWKCNQYINHGNKIKQRLWC